MAATTAACKRLRDRRRLAAEAAPLARGCSKFRRARSSSEAVNFMISGAGVRRIHGLRLSNTRKCQHSRDCDSGRGEYGGDLASHNHMVLHSHSFAALWRPALTAKCAGSTLLVSRKSRKAYSAALNNQKSCVVSLPEPLSPQRYHKPSPGRIGCEECCCHLTTSYLVGVRDHGGRHDRCSGRRHQGKHQSEENEELAHVSLT